MRTAHPLAAQAQEQAAAAVLSRLWQALLREPVPGVADVDTRSGRARVRWADGQVAHGPTAAPFAPAPAGLRVRFGGTAHTDPARLVAALPLPAAPRARLAAEVADSVANLAMAYRQAPAPPDLAALTALPPADAAVLAEQLVVDGHPLHPCCRTRLPMTRAQVRAYAPEYRPVVPVRWWRVPAGRWHSTGAGLPPLLPVHPWQEAHLDPAAHGLRPDARVSATRPLMSLRTVALDAATHLKLAVDVQMTSAVRRVSPAAVHNGPLLSDLTAAIARRLPGFEVLAETAAGAVCVDGRPQPALAVVRRRAPRLAAGQLALPLAALTAAGTADAPPLAVQAARLAYRGDPAALLDGLLGVLLPPVMALLAAGVALEAHGQNLLVVLESGRPVRLLYRDFGGVRVSPRRLAAAGFPAPPLVGDVVSDDPRVLRTKLAAAVGVVVGQLVAVCAAAGADEGGCWARVSRHLAAACAAVPGAAADEAAWRSAPVPVKATTAMRLADDPLADRWAQLPYGWEGPA